MIPASSLGLVQLMPSGAEMSYAHRILPQWQICEHNKYWCCFEVVNTLCSELVTWVYVFKIDNSLKVSNFTNAKRLVFFLGKNGEKKILPTSLKIVQNMNLSQHQFSCEHNSHQKQLAKI